MKKEIILIEGFLDSPDYLTIAGINASVIEKIFGYKHVFLTNSNKKINKNKDLLRELGIYKFENMLYKPAFWISLALSFFSLLKLFNIKSKQDLINLKIYKIQVGDLLYDSYIRLNNVNDYQNFNPSRPRFIFHFIKSMIYSYYFILYLNKFDVKYVVLSHRIYLQYGLIGRIVQKKSGFVVIPWKTAVRVYHPEDDLKMNHYKPSDSIIQKMICDTDLLKKIDIYIHDRLNGNVNQYDVKEAFTGKEIINKETLVNLLKLDSSKPIVYLLPHVFSDAPHCNESMLYSDFWDWFKSSIDYMEELDNANWIVKQHPSAGLYGEKDEIYSYYSMKEYKNVKLFPKDLSSKIVFDTADSIVTVHGTGGLEAASIGIKPIICGQAPYSGFNIADEPKTIQEYKNLLKNVTRKNLSDDQIVIAKAILYWIQEYSYIKSNILSDQLIIPSIDKCKVDEQIIQMKNLIISNLKKYKIQDDNYYICLEDFYSKKERFLGIYNFEGLK